MARAWSWTAAAYRVNVAAHVFAGDQVIARIRVEKALPSLANARLHWAKKAKVIKAQRVEVMSRWLCLPLADRRRPVARVVFVRTSPRQLDDDNLASAF